MSSFKGVNLFSGGPCRFIVHGLTQRHALHERAGFDGGAVTAMGQSVRRIEQVGALAADTLGQLQARLDAIESAMDGQTGELVDGHGRVHPDVMMIRFAPGEIRRSGPRLTCDYTIDYVAGR